MSDEDELRCLADPLTHIKASVGRSPLRFRFTDRDQDPPPLRRAEASEKH